jgi:hypothetical protein
MLVSDLFCAIANASAFASDTPTRWDRATRANWCRPVKREATAACHAWMLRIVIWRRAWRVEVAVVHQRARDLLDGEKREDVRQRVATQGGRRREGALHVPVPDDVRIVVCSSWSRRLLQQLALIRRCKRE